MINTLIISGGSFQGSALIKGLKHSDDVRIHMADCFHDNINKYECDLFHQIPRISQKIDFVNRIEQIVHDHNIQVIFPSTDHELDLISKKKDSLENSGARIAISDYGLNQILSDKIKTHQFLKQHAFPLLDAVDIQSPDIVYPIIGKPAFGCGGKGIIILRSRNEHKHALNSVQLSNYLWTPFLEKFNEFSIDFAISFDGNVSPISIRKRIRTVGGFAVITQSETNDIIQRQIMGLSEILKNNGGCGLFNVQVIQYGGGHLHFSDINPRVGTSSVFTLGVGINLPLFMCQSLIKCPETPIASHIDHHHVKMVRNLDEKWIKVKPKGEVKGFVFDLDDTLIDAKTWMFDKLSLLYKQHSHQLPDKEMFMLAAYRFFEEGKRGTLIDELKNLFDLSEDLRTAMIQTFRIAQPDTLRVYRDVENNLAHLKRSGFKLGLLTDNPVRSQQQKIDMLDCAHYFDTILLSETYGREKPDRFLFEKISGQLGLDPQNLVMVGDNLYRDCYGAVMAGYNSAYLIERKGAFFNFNYSYFLNMIKPSMDKIVRIASLNELYYAFEDRSSGEEDGL